MMLTNIRNSKRGFTLIELLVVIAIIGILSAVVLASLQTARQKARDATRISDLKNLQLSLELYYDSRQAYPGQTTNAIYDASTLFTAAGWTASPMIPIYLPSMPADPSSRGATFAYSYIGLDAANANCNGAFSGNQPVACASYYLGATLERNDNTVLTTDQDTPNSVAPFYAYATTACGASTAAAGIDNCYSLRP